MATVGPDFDEYRIWLEEAGVDTSAIIEVEDEFTSSFFVTTDLDNNQIASFYMGAMGRADTLSFNDLEQTTGITAIEMACISPNAPAAMVKYARECQELGIPYIYDPSQQIVRLSSEELLEGTRGAHVLIVNEYEFGMLMNKTGLAADELLTLPDITIITRGEHGAEIHAENRIRSVPIAPPEPLVEPTGVGDAYRAGIIKGMLRRYTWETTGRIAALAAAYVLEQHGTQDHRYTIEQFVGRYRRVFGDAPELEDLLASTKRANETASRTSID
jgi:adenosine kinase